MYALPNKTQHKLIVKVRGGISQKLDNLTSSTSPSNNSSTSLTLSSTPFRSVSSVKDFAKHADDAGFNAELSHLPQPIFHSIPYGNKSKSISNNLQRASRQYITPQHNEMIKYVQQSWKGVESDYKKSANNYINNLDLNNSSGSNLPKHKQAKKKTVTTSTPLLLSGSYHHTSISKSSSNNQQHDSFQPFDLEAFWGNRILKRLTEEP